MTLLMALLISLLFPLTSQATDRITNREFFTDPTAAMTLEQVRHQAFIPYQTPLYQGYSTSATWVRLHIDPGADANSTLILRISIPNYLDEIALFDPDLYPLQTVAPRYTGDQHPLPLDDYFSINLGFIIPAGQTPRDIYLRIKTTSIQYLNVTAQNLPETQQLDARQSFTLTLAWSFPISVLGWALLIWLRDREKVIGAFTLQQTISVCHLLVSIGFGRILFPDSLASGVLDKSVSLLHILVVAATFSFEVIFLREFKPPVWLWRSMVALLSLSVIAAILLLQGETRAALKINMYLVMLGPPLAFLLAITARAWDEQGEKSSALLPRWMLVSSHALFFTGTVASALPALNLIEKLHSQWTVQGFYLYPFINSTLMLGLMEIRYLRRENNRRKALTRLVAAEQEAKELARRREEQEQFLATTSHELRTPLNGIIGISELALADDLSHQERMGYLRQIAASGHVLIDTISGVLDIAKIESGKLDLEHIAFDLHELLHRIESNYSALAKVRNLTFSLAMDPNLPRQVVGDPTRLRQILVNYVSNALKFTQQGYIKLSAHPLDSGRLRFEVEDSGIGIAPEAQQRLFQPYVQADQSTTRRYGGTGLGLSICRKIAHLMQGEVGVKTTEGQGSCFWAEVALQISNVESEAIETTDKLPPSIRGYRVLAAEDNAVNRMVVKRMLEKAEAITVIVENGQQAVDTFSQSLNEGPAFDVILMDVQMPIMSGLEATRKIRQMQGGRQIPIIALTAGATPREREEALDAGMNDFATKPISMKALLEQIHAVIHPAP